MLHSWIWLQISPTESITMKPSKHEDYGQLCPSTSIINWNITDSSLFRRYTMSVPHIANEVISGLWAEKWLHGFFLSSSSFCSWNTRWLEVIMEKQLRNSCRKFWTLRMLTWWLAAYNFTAYFLLANMLEWDSCLLWNTNIDLNNWHKDFFWWLVG